jgi:Abhydrolase family
LVVQSSAMALTRRDLGRLAVGVAAGQAVGLAAQTRPEYIGPLTGEERLEDRRFDPVVVARDRYAAAPRRLRFDARTPADAQAWQMKLRAKLTELLGGFPDARTPLRPAVLETRSFGSYRREKIVFDSAPGVSVLAYVLTPASVTTRVPAVICIPGHGRGVDDIVGIDEQGRDRTDKAAISTTSPSRSSSRAWRLSRLSRWDSDAGAIRGMRKKDCRRKPASRSPAVR